MLAVNEPPSCSESRFFAKISLDCRSSPIRKCQKVQIDGTSRLVDFHALRHTYITMLAKSGAPLKVVQEMARHSDPKLTLGCYTHDDKPSPVLEHGPKAFDHHTVIVACAGNAGSDRPYWPAALKRVVAVASLDAHGRDRAAFSNYGWWVDACSLGADVVSSFFSFDDPAGDGHEAEHFAGYASWSGTSFAAPRVAGAIAARAAGLGVSAAKAAADLLDGSVHPSMPDLGVLVDVGAGRP